MAIYEIEGPDGKVYEVEADSIDAAASAASSFFGTSSNSPVTEADEPAMTEGPFGMQVPAYMMEGAKTFDQEYKENERDFLGSTNQFFDSAANAVGVGVPELAERYVGGAADYAGSALTGDNDEMSYMDFVRRVGAEQKQRRDDNPTADVLGTVVGSVLGGALGGGALRELAEQGAPAAVRAVGTWGGRLGAAAAGGAAQNTGIALGRGDIDGMGDLIGTGALGAAFGAGGQALGEVVNAAGRGILSHIPGKVGKGFKQTAAKKELARSLLEGRTGKGSIAAFTNDGKGYTPDDLMALAAHTGGPDGRMLAEANPKLLRTLQAYSGAPSTTGMTGKVDALAATRQAAMSEAAPNTLISNLDGLLDVPVTPKNNDAFREIFNTPAARNTPVTTKAEIIGGLSKVARRGGDPLLDPVNNRGASERIVNKLIAELDDVTDREGITLQALQNVKLKLSDDAAKAWRGAEDQSYKLNAIDTTTLKNYVNDLIKQIDPRYADVAATRAEHEVERRMISLGKDLISGNVKSQPINEVLAQLDELDPAELNRVRQGAAEFLRDKVKAQPSYLKKFAQENPDLMERANAILGPHFQAGGTSLQDIAQSIDTNLTGAANYGKIGKAVDSQAAATLGPDTEQVRGIQGLTDILRIAADAVTGNIGGGAAMSGRRALNSGPEMFQREVMNWLTQSDPKQAAESTNELIKLFNMPNASLRSGIAGGGLAAGLNTQLQ